MCSIVLTSSRTLVLYIVTPLLDFLALVYACINVQIVVKVRFGTWGANRGILLPLASSCEPLRALRLTRSKIQVRFGCLEHPMAVLLCWGVRGADLRTPWPLAASFEHLRASCQEASFIYVSVASASHWDARGPSGPWRCQFLGMSHQPGTSLDSAYLQGLVLGLFFAASEIPPEAVQAVSYTYCTCASAFVISTFISFYVQQGVCTSMPMMLPDIMSGSDCQ